VTQGLPNESLDASGRERVSHQEWSGDAFVKWRRHVDSTVGWKNSAKWSV